MAPPRISRRPPSNRLISLAHTRALFELRNRYRDEFERLVDKHRLTLGLPRRRRN